MSREEIRDTDGATGATPEEQLLFEWLVRCIEFRRVAPRQLEILRARTDEFELLPIPVGLIERCSRKPMAHEPFLELLPDGPWETVSPSNMGNRSELLQLVCAFATAVEEADSAALAAILAPSYRDGNGRNKEEMMARIAEIGRRSTRRRMIISRVSILQDFTDTVCGQVEGAWEAEGAERRAAQTFQVNMTARQSSAGTWELSSIGEPSPCTVSGIS